MASNARSAKSRSPSWRVVRVEAQNQTVFRDVKLVAEPAAAVATAALFGPLRDKLAGKRVALIVCGSNIDATRFAELLCRGALVHDAEKSALRTEV